MKLRCRRLKRSGLWVITGLPGPDIKWAGPYKVRAEALDDKRGMERFFEDYPEMAKTEKKPRTSSRKDYLKQLISDTRSALEQLTPDTVDWFKKRMAYLLYYAERKEDLPENSKK
jgi:hypothetical protein